MKPTQSIAAAMKTAASVRALTPPMIKNGGAVAQGQRATQKTRSDSSQQPKTWEEKAALAKRERHKERQAEEAKRRRTKFLERAYAAAQGTLKNADDLTR